MGKVGLELVMRSSGVRCGPMVVYHAGEELLEALRGLQGVPGSYVLALEASRSRWATVGRLGTCCFPQGYYYYVGSAFGPGGLRARLSRYFQPPQRRHWHIDYLLEIMSVVAVGYVTGPPSREHEWARRLAAAAGIRVPVPAFGSSDCHCPAHLFWSRGYRRFEGILAPADYGAV